MEFLWFRLNPIPILNANFTILTNVIRRLEIVGTKCAKLVQPMPVLQFLRFLTTKLNQDFKYKRKDAGIPKSKVNLSVMNRHVSQSKTSQIKGHFFAAANHPCAMKNLQFVASSLRQKMKLKQVICIIKTMVYLYLLKCRQKSLYSVMRICQRSVPLAYPVDIRNKFQNH